MPKETKAKSMPSKSTSCPNKDEFELLDAGQLSHQRREEILVHAENCEQCLSRLEAIPGVSELVDALVAELGDDRYVRELELAEVIAGLKEKAPNPDGLGAAAEESSILSNAIIGDFKIVREIGRGGMGVVYEARQLSLDRRVALKVMPFTSLLRPLQLARFENEARAAASLHHENIVPVFAVGSDRGSHYFAMQFVDGHDLRALLSAAAGEPPVSTNSSSAAATQTNSQAVKASDDRGREEVYRDGPETVANRANTTIADHPLATRLSGAPKAARSRDFRLIASLMYQAAKALEYAHEQGVVHRDVKPSNLMVEASGKLWLMDFGLARVENDSALTMTGDFLGTLPYMSPEQASGDHGVVDHRSDIYSLGATFYELLTLRPMFSDPDRIALLHQVVEVEPAPPRTFDRRIPTDLETIVLKATAKEVYDRYATAGEMAADLDRYLNEKPIAAKRLSIFDRFWRWSRRHRAVASVALVAILCIALLASTSAALLSWKNQQLFDEKRRTEQALVHSLNNEYALGMRQAFDAIASHDPTAAHTLLVNLIPESSEPDVRGFEWAFLDDKLTNTRSAKRLSEAAIYTIARAPSGNLLAAAGQSGELFIVDAGSLSVRHTIDTGQIEVNALSFSPDGRHLASSGDDGTIRIWDWESRKEVRKIKASSEGITGALSFIDGGRRLISTNAGDSRIYLWDAANGEPSGQYAGHSSAIRALDVSSDSRLAASVEESGQIKVWDIANCRTLRQFHLPNERARAVAFSPDDEFIITGHNHGALRFWAIHVQADCEIGRCFPEVKNVAFDQRLDRFIATNKTGAMRVWQFEDWTDFHGKAKAAGRPVHEWFCENDPPPTWMGFSPDGRFAAAWCDRTLYFHDVLKNTTIQHAVPEAAVLAHGHHQPGDNQLCAFSRDGQRFACLNHVYRRVESESGAVGWKWQYKLKSKADGVHGLAFTPDSQTIVEGGRGYVALYRVADGEQISDDVIQHPRAYDRHNYYTDLVAISADGRLAACASVDHEIDIVDLQKQAPIGVLPGHGGGEILDLHFAGDGRTLISCGYHEQEPHLWDVQSLKQTGTLPLHKGATPRSIDSAAFSPDGRYIVSGTNGPDGSVRVWDHRHQKTTWQCCQPADVVRFSTDGRQILTADFITGRFSCWDFENIKQRAATLSHTSAGMDEIQLPTSSLVDHWHAHDGQCHAILPDARSGTLWTAGADGWLKQWDRRKERAEQVLSPANPQKEQTDLDFAVAPDGESIAIVGDSTLRLHASNGHYFSQTASAPADGVTCVAMLPDGRRIITGHEDGEIVIRDALTLDIVSRHSMESGSAVREITVSGDGQLYAARYGKPAASVFVFDVVTREVVKRMGPRAPGPICFSPIGQILAIAQGDDVSISDFQQDNQPAVLLQAHRSGVSALAFSSTGNILATASADQSIVLWNMSSGEPMKTLVGHTTNARCLAFSPDDRSLISGGERGPVNVWNVDAGMLLGELLPQECARLVVTRDPYTLIALQPGGVVTVRQSDEQPAVE